MKYVMLTLLLLVNLRNAPAQTQGPTNRPPSGDDLQQTTIGEAVLFGRRAAFRIYESPDHTQALVYYGKFQSTGTAKQGTKQWLKERKVTRHEHIKDLNGRVVGDRIVASPKKEKKAFIVVRRHGLNYWFIQSVSLPVAMQVDGLIEPAQ